MEKEGYVSIWVGKFKSNKDLQNYLSISYTEDGEAIPSKFETVLASIIMTRILGKSNILMEN